MNNVLLDVSKPNSNPIYGRENDQAIKSALPSLFLLILLGITSFLNYFKIREIFWAAELPPYVFCALACFFALSITSYKKGIIQIGLSDTIIVVFILYSIVITYITTSPFLPSDRIYELLGGLLCYISLRLLLSQAGMKIMLYGIFFIMLFQACWGLLQYCSWLPSFTGRLGIQGGFINPGIYGCCMSIGTLLGLYLLSLYNGPRTGRVSLSLAWLVVIAALVLSLSRTAYLTSLVGAGCLFFVRAEKKQLIVSKKLRYLLLILIGAILSGLTYYLWQRNVLSVAGRFLIWKISGRMLMENPLWGMGYGSFLTQYGNYQAAYFQSGKGTTEDILTAGTNYYAFNELLRIAIENGLVGLGIFISAVVITIAQGVQQIKARQPHAVFFTILLISILAFGSFSYPFQSTTLTCIFYLSIAVLASFHKPLFSFGFKRIFRLFLFMPTCLLLILCLQKINALLNWKKAEDRMVYAEGDALRNYGKIYNELNNNGAFLFNYGAVLAAMGNDRQSELVLDRAHHYLSNIQVTTLLAEVNYRLNKKEKARQYYLLAANIDPKLFVPLERLLHFYLAIGDTANAVELAKKIVSKQVKISSSEISRIKAFALHYLYSAGSNPNNIH